MDQNENEFLASFSQDNAHVNMDVKVEEYEYCSCSSSCIRNEITILKIKIEKVEEKLDAILQKMDTNIIKNCDKMGEHIDFVNNVYDTVKVPLHYISNKVQKMIGGGNSVAVATYRDLNTSNKIKMECSNDDEYLFTEND